MADEKSHRTGEPVAFGPFVLHADKRLLECGGSPVQLGGRALDILIALTTNPGEVITKRDLMARVWPDLTVDESNLRFQMTALRKALGETQSGERYITTVSGRGYCFVAHVSATGSAAVQEIVSTESSRLPLRLKRMVGRDSAITEITSRLKGNRFVSVVGPGGIGKTTVAVAIAHDMLANFRGAVRFFDLSPLTNAQLAASAIASSFGLLVQNEDTIGTLVHFLHDKRMLLVFDSCEHLIEWTAALAERICHECPDVSILATSREPLRAEGEQVYRIEPLAWPLDEPGLTAAASLQFPATQLFVERVAASGHPFQLNDANAAVVAEICRKLDGIALAIELAAGNVEAYGLDQTAALLGERFDLPGQGRRTAVPRHQTLTAMLDWSHELLSEVEKKVLRRIAIFVGMFTLEGYLAVACGDDLDAGETVSSIAGLVKKSLVATSAGDAPTFYRLLDTTRSYALGKLIESKEVDSVARRHAVYFRDLLDQLEFKRRRTVGQRGYPIYAPHLGNIRSALEWSFENGKDPRLAIELAISAGRTFYNMSLLTDAFASAERAIALLDDTTLGTQLEMSALTLAGVSGMFTRGNSETVRAAYMRSLELAEALDNPVRQLRLLGCLHIFHERIGDYRGALSFALRSEGVAREIRDPAAVSAARSLVGIGHHLVGDQAAARTHLEAALALPSVSDQIYDNHFGFYHENRARIALARTLWLQGFADQAQNLARSTVEEAESLDHPVSLCIALIWAVSVSLWSEDFDSTEDYIEQFIAHADKHSLKPYLAVGQGVRGQLLIKRNQADKGIGLITTAMQSLDTARYALLNTTFNETLAEGLAAMGKQDDALSKIDAAVLQVERGGDMYHMPELLRIKAEILASRDGAAYEAEAYFSRSIALAREQSSLGWELRSSIGLALLRSKQNADALEVLAPVLERFSEGFNTGNLKTARRILDGLSA
ncbi:MAG: winged helix-turn-helix domain-containing protein [Pseudolabrys sp.]|nr:winged helix-turn-helix domain-containing protein [Pseudolabrys sp.]